MTLTSFREALAAKLATDLAIEFVPGRVLGPIEARDLGCTFPRRIEEVGGQVDDENLIVGVRVLKQWTQRVAPEGPRDPAPLETLAEDLQATVKAHQTDLGPWFIRVTEIDFDLDAWAIEATIVGWQANAGL